MSILSTSIPSSTVLVDDDTRATPSRNESAKDSSSRNMYSCGISGLTAITSVTSSRSANSARTLNDPTSTVATESSLTHNAANTSLIEGSLSTTAADEDDEDVFVQESTDPSLYRACIQARKMMMQRFEGQSIYRWNSPTVRTIPKFAKIEIAVGRRLGKGTFSNVDEIRGIMIQPDKSLSRTRKTKSSQFKLTHPSSTTSGSASGAVNVSARPSSIPLSFKRIARPGRGLKRDDTVASDDRESRVFIAQHCFRNTGEARYAIKMIRRDVWDSNKDEDLIAAICDLVVETVFLSALEHPNIIKCRAIAALDHPFTKDYFLILDRLKDTLQQRIELWKTKEAKLYSMLGRLRDRKGFKRLDFFEHRLEQAFDLGSAIEYLHDKMIIHRDIKPDNIGFDVRDDIKLFDFGMTRELSANLKVDEENYRLSMCGSPRYMAPEVWLRKPYNSTCDVYSFGVVFYEMITMNRAYGFCKTNNLKDFHTKIFLEGQRPNVEHIRAPPSIKELLPFCWHNNPEYRCCMSSVNKILRQELILLRKGDESTLPDFTRRRSTFIFCQGSRKSRDGSSKSFEESIQSILDTSLRSNRSLKAQSKKRETVTLDKFNLSDLLDGSHRSA